jgi:phosphoribosylformylglycinamidine synthase
MKKFGVIRFLGTNCDRDVFQAIEGVGLQAEWLWYENHFDSNDYQALFLPGGFSYGDYLRCGALAAKAPVMDSVREAAKRGTPILGICNGFQILCESGLLPGVLIRNENLKFICEDVQLKVVNNQTPFSSSYKAGEVITVPIAHGEGNYYCEPTVLKELEQNNQIVFKYEGKNPNGSLANIAGICNKEKTVLGMMPHPERCAENVLGNNAGLKVFESILKAVPALA